MYKPKDKKAWHGKKQQHNNHNMPIGPQQWLYLISVIENYKISIYPNEPTQKQIQVGLTDHANSTLEHKFT